MKNNTSPILLAFVGMPGSGKSEAVSYLSAKNIPFVRFGEITDEGLKNSNLSLTEENEKKFREQLRKDLGMAAYAIKSEPKIREFIALHPFVAIDGLYSWEEYKYLKEKFPQLILVQIYATPQKRYERLSKRQVRPRTFDESRQRDIDELEKLNKGGPIAIADYSVENNSDDISDLHQKIETILQSL